MLLFGAMEEAMTLTDYLKAPTIDAEAFAKSCGTTLGQLKQIAYGYRNANPALAINIERESGGAVRCEDLRPDVDWKYIRSAKAGKSRAA
jgi:DNA-binding transcriptional regulator YdaS (Cro superfamily)